MICMDILRFMILDLGFLSLNGPGLVHAPPAPVPRSKGMPVGVWPLGWMTLPGSLEGMRSKHFKKVTYQIISCGTHDVVEMMKLRRIRFHVSWFCREINRNLWKSHRHHGTSIRALRSAVNALDSASKPGWSHLTTEGWTSWNFKFTNQNGVSCNEICKLTQFQ